jgi:hypothetical protein
LLDVFSVVAKATKFEQECHILNQLFRHTSICLGILVGSFLLSRQFSSTFGLSAWICQEWKLERMDYGVIEDFSNIKLIQNEEEHEPLKVTN